MTYVIAVAKKYQHILVTANASELLRLTSAVQRHAMRALAHLAKFNGSYEQWQKIIKQHGLHWRHADDNFDFFEKESITEMIAYIKQVIKMLPPDCGNTFIVATLLGLRADEVCSAIRMIKQGTEGYHNKERCMLEHYRHKEVFIRRSKKAYISLVDDDLISLAKQSCDSWQTIRSRLKRRHTPMNMKYTRKVFGTWLRQRGVESEFIDLLQGRTPTSIFGRHYYRPDFDQQAERIRHLLRELKKELVG